MRSRFLVIVTLIALAVSSWAACGFDAVSNSGYQTGASSYSWSHTVTGSNTVLVVSVPHNNSCAFGDVTSVTFNSVALTHIAEAGPSCRSVDMWYLLSPASGAHTITVNYSGTFNIWGMAVSLTGVSALDASGTASPGSSNTQISVSLTTTVANDCLVASSIFDDTNAVGITMSPGTQDFTNTAVARNFNVSTGHDLLGAAALYTETFTLTGSANNIIGAVAAAFKPSGGGATVNCTLSTLGAGPC